MHESEAKHAQLPTHLHMVSGLGGGNMNASNGGRVGNEVNHEYFKKIAAARRATKAMGNAPSAMGQEMCQERDPDATAKYTAGLVESLKTKPAPGIRELTVGAKLEVMSVSWHCEAGPAPWHENRLYECPSCWQHKREGFCTTMRWNASPVQNQPCCLTIRNLVYLCEECQERQLAGGDFDASVEDVAQFRRQIANPRIEVPVGQETVPELTVETMVSSEFVAMLSTKAAMDNLSMEDLDLVLGKILLAVKKINIERTGKTLIKLNHVGEKEIKKLKEKHGPYNHRSATVLKTDAMFEDILILFDISPSWSNPDIHYCNVGAVYNALSTICVLDTYQNITQQLAWMKESVGPEASCSLHGLYWIWQACRDSAEIDLKSERSKARTEWSNCLQGNKTARDFLQNLDEKYHAVLVLEMKENPLWRGLDDFVRCEQLERALNATTLKRYSQHMSSEAQTRRRNLGTHGGSSKDGVVDIDSWKYARSIVEMICLDDDTIKRVNERTSGTVSSDNDQKSTIHQRLEARVAAMERDYHDRKGQDERSERGRKRGGREGSEKTRDRRSQSEPPTKRPKSDCPLCGESGHTMSRCLKFSDRGIKYNDKDGFFVYGSNGKEKFCSDDSLCYWRSEQFKQSPMGQRKIVAWEDLKKRSPEKAEKILKGQYTAKATVSAVSGAHAQEESDVDSDSSDSGDDDRSRGRFKKERRDVGQFAGQFKITMLSGAGGTAPADQVPQEVQLERENVATFVNETFEAGGAQVQGDAQVQDNTAAPTTLEELWGTAEPEERPTPGELNTLEGIAGFRGRFTSGPLSQAGDTGADAEGSPSTPTPALEAVQADPRGVADPPLRSPTSMRGAVQCQDVERAGELLAEQQRELDSIAGFRDSVHAVERPADYLPAGYELQDDLKDAASERQETAAERHSRVHSGDVDVFDSSRAHERTDNDVVSEMGPNALVDEVQRSSGRVFSNREHERRVNDAIAALEPNTVDGGVRVGGIIDELLPIRAGPCPHSDNDDCCMWNCVQESDVSNWAEGAEIADDGGSRHMQRVIQDVNRRQHVVVARPMVMSQEGQVCDDSNPSLTRAEHACQLQEIALNSRTSIACTWRDGVVRGTVYENYLHFDIYGDGHDCFLCARVIADHYDVIDGSSAPDTEDQAGGVEDDTDHVFEDCMKAQVSTRSSYPDEYIIRTRRHPPTGSTWPGLSTGGGLRPPQTAATQNLVILDIQRQTGTRIRCKLSEDGVFTYFTIRGAEYQRAADLLAHHFDIIDGQSSIADSDSDDLSDGDDDGGGPDDGDDADDGNVKLFR